VPGISVPEEVRVRMREAGERGREVGVELAYEVITQARERGLIQGCYLMPSFGRYDLVGELAAELLRTAVDYAVPGRASENSKPCPCPPPSPERAWPATN